MIIKQRETFENSSESTGSYNLTVGSGLAEVDTHTCFLKVKNNYF